MSSRGATQRFFYTVSIFLGCETAMALGALLRQLTQSCRRVLQWCGPTSSLLEWKTIEQSIWVCPQGWKLILIDMRKGRCLSCLWGDPQSMEWIASSMRSLSGSGRPSHFAVSCKPRTSVTLRQPMVELEVWIWVMNHQSFAKNLRTKSLVRELSGVPT